MVSQSSHTYIRYNLNECKPIKFGKVIDKRADKEVPCVFT